MRKSTTYTACIVWNELSNSNTPTARVAETTVSSKQEAIDIAVGIKRTLSGSKKTIQYGYIMGDAQLDNDYIREQKLSIARSNVGRISCFVVPEAMGMNTVLDVFVTL